jgi:hypothetical protein
MNSFQSKSSNKGLIGLIGILYLIIIACGVYAHFMVRTPLLLLDGSSEVEILKALQQNEMQIRFSIAADFIMVLSDIFVAFLFYILLKPIHRNLSSLAAIFRLIQSVIIIGGIVLLCQLLPLIQGDTAWSSGQMVSRAGWALNILNIHAQVYIFSGIFFGISCTFLGRLFLKADFFPDFLGIFLSVAGMAYVADGFTNILFPKFAPVTEGMVIIAALIAEILVCVWFLIIGLKGIQMRKRKPATLL